MQRNGHVTEQAKHDQNDPVTNLHTKKENKKRGLQFIIMVDHNRHVGHVYAKKKIVTISTSPSFLSFSFPFPFLSFPSPL
jgi:hypothetical protein